jgi:D-inositol-3-phosphate glycosyltransferase
MRIAMVSEHASPLAVLGGVDAGGQNVHVAALAEALARREHEVVVHTRRDDPSLPRRVAMGEGVIVDHVDAGPPSEVPKDELLPYMASFAEQLREQWLEDRPDVVHSHFWMSALAALDAAEGLDIPVVQTFHALGVVKRRHQGRRDTSPRGRIPLERDIAGRVERVIATCTDEVAELERMGAMPRSVVVVPCGVDRERFRPDGPAETRTAGRHRLVAACRLVERKGIGDLLHALVELPDTELHVAGGPDAAQLCLDPEGRRLIRLAERLGVGDRLRLRGRISRDAMPLLLRSADLAVCVPWYEPFGIVPLEAMACGIPVVASAVGGQVDSVADGRTGRLVPPRDPAALARVVGQLLDDPQRRRSLGAAGVRRVRRLYDFDRIAMLTERVYRDVLAGVARVPSDSGALA